MIEIKDLTKVYNSSKLKTHALRGINLSISHREFVSIVGKSGCGKTTLLNIIGGIDCQSSGDYFFEGNSIKDLKDVYLAKFRNSSIGYIFQSFHLIRELNLLDNVSMPLGYYGIGKRDRIERSLELLEMVGLEELAYKYPNELSGGQMQRVAIARALSNNPKLILADEPTGNLDVRNSQIIISILKRIQESGNTVILITHDGEMAKIGNRIITISDGKII